LPVADFFLRVGDTTSIIRTTLEDSTGAAVNIQGATVKFRVAPINGSGTPVINTAASNDQNGTGVDGSKGKVSYAWVAGNTNVSGLYLADWQVTYSGGGIQTFPNDSYILVRITPEGA
jgi:hypothetical protein